MSDMINTPIISYFDVDKIGNLQQLAWSCQLHKLLVPIKKQAQVNIFEQTILQLIEEGVDTIEKLGQTTGLSKDFVRFIVQRLKFLELLDSYLKLTTQGKETISLLDEIQEQGQNSVIGILVENTTGKLLDIVTTDRSTQLNVEEYFNSRIIINIGTSGKPKKISLRIVGNHSKTNAINISTTSVRSVFKNFNKRLYSGKNPITAENSESANLTIHRNFEQIEFVGEPIDVYLHCAVFFDKNCNFVSVEDGFGYSLALTKALPKDISNNIKNKVNIKELNSHPTLGERINQKEIETDIILSALTASQKSFTSITSYYHNPNKTTNGAKDSHTNERELFKSLYDAVEHTLAYVNHQRKFDEWGSFVKESHKRNYDNLRNILLNKLKFNDSEKMFRQLSKVTYGQVKSLSQGNISLMPLLVKNIYASQNLDNHPFSSLATIEPNLFNVLHRLKGLRNTVSHGEQTRELDFDEIKNIYETVLKVITFLYPKSVKAQVNSIQDIDRISQKLLKAELRLDSYFKYPLPESVRENLFRLFELNYDEIEINGQTTEIITPADKLKYIRHLSASLEKTLKYRIGQSIRQNSKVDYSDVDFQRFIEGNSSPIDKSLQKKLDTLDYRKVKQLIENINNLPLMDLLIVYLLLEQSGQSQSLELLRNQSVNIINVAMRIHQLRGHNNAITEEFEKLSDSALIKLQQQVFLVINILTNFYDS